MTEPAVAPDTPDVAETISFLRRFADRRANVHNGVYLRRAADFLETLTVQAVSASDQERLLRHKYETLTQHTDALEAEREALKNHIEGHLEIASSLVAERDALGGTLQMREAELAVLREALSRERDKLRARIKTRDDQLATFRMASEREHDALKEKVLALEADRLELRSAFDRINTLRNRTILPQAGTEAAVAARPGAGAEALSLQLLPNGQEVAGGETSAVVPITTLRQARAQFEYLAREFIPLGDIASQVMCELGAYTMDMALIGGQPNDHLAVDEVARSILAPASLNRA